MLNLSGQVGIDTLPRFSTANFEIVGAQSAVPEPSSFAMLGGGIALLTFGTRRRRD
jgi:hypothetical protein